MSKRKGVSAEEKKSRMLQLFYERKEFFQLKELEKIAPKEKGIIANSVKQVVESLVDDGLVDTDKIGSSVYFWAFPSKAINAREKKLEALQKAVEDGSEKLKSAAERVAKVKVGREDTAERNEILNEIIDLQLEKDALTKKLDLHNENDPEIIERIQKEALALKEAANRWTDNIFSVKSWCSKKFNTEGALLDKQFGIPSDLDYLE